VEQPPGPGRAGSAAGETANSVAISALTGEGLPDLLASIERVLDEELVRVNVRLPFQRGDLLGLIHQRGVVTDEVHDENGTRVTGKIPASLFPYFEPHLINRKS
jgi:GTPase